MFQIIDQSVLGRSAKLWLSALVLASLSACGDGRISDLKEFVDTAYQDEKPEIEPLPIIEPYKGFEYASSELSDPYSVSNVIDARDDESRAEAQRDENRRREPLEDHPLDALAMVGTMTQKGVPWVIVKTTQGTAHLATIGNYMGLNEGKITEIFPDEQRIVLVETVPDPAGRLVAREVEVVIDEVE